MSYLKKFVDWVDSPRGRETCRVIAQAILAWVNTKDETQEDDA